MEYRIRKAMLDEAGLVLELYHSLIGCPGCTWDMEYPALENVSSDISNDSLHCLYSDNGELVAAAYAGENELAELTCWDEDISNPCELARIGVRAEFQNKGLAAKLIQYIEREVKSQDNDGIHFLVSETNSSALALYKKMGYYCCGKTNRYGSDWLCYEKKL